MSLHQIVYVSSARRVFSDEQLLALLDVSRRNNAKVNVSGMLLYWDGNFMQALEGEKQDVDTVHARIAQDPRHHGLITLLHEPIAERSFGEWTMGFRHIQSDVLADMPGYSDFLDADGRQGGTEKSTRALQLLRSFRDRVR
jgi:hypothetical protein